MEINAVQNTGAVETQAPVSQTAGQGGFSSYLQTTSSLEEIFTEASECYHVPKNLIKAIAKAESNFDPSVTSRSGAQGVMQLMPATAQALGVEDAYDPYQNIMGGTKYIGQLLEKYDGDVTLALAAYNAGSGNVKKYGGVPPFKETQNYVVKVTNYMNEGVDVPDASYAVNSGAGSSGGTQNASGSGRQSQEAEVSAATVEEAHDSYLQKILNQIFSYEDYLKFIELYTKTQQEQKEKERDEQKQQSQDRYTYQQIKYNPAVMNLLSGI